MKVLENLFVLNSLECGEGNCQASLMPRLDSPIYKAHFPGSPITPGACLVQAVGEILEQATGKKQQLVKVKNVKFMNMIVPGDGAAVNIDIQYNSADGSAKAVVSKSGSVYSKISLVYNV